MKRTIITPKTSQINKNINFLTIRKQQEPVCIVIKENKQKLLL